LGNLVIEKLKTNIGPLSHFFDFSITKFPNY